MFILFFTVHLLYSCLLLTGERAPQQHVYPPRRTEPRPPAAGQELREEERDQPTVLPEESDSIREGNTHQSAEPCRCRFI